MSSHIDFNWKLEAPIVDKTNSPIMLIEKFFTDYILEHICIEALKYEKLKGSHILILTWTMLKHFSLFYFLVDMLISLDTPCLGKDCRCVEYFHIITPFKEQI